MAAMDEALDELAPGVVIGGPLGKMEKLIERAGFGVMARTPATTSAAPSARTPPGSRARPRSRRSRDRCSSHPVVMHPDGGCLLIGDTYLITETGVERMNRAPRDLAVV